MVGNMFVSGDEVNLRVEQMKALNSALLAFYEAVHRNRNFIATLGNIFCNLTTCSTSRPIAERSNSSFVKHCRGLGDPSSDPGRVESSN